MGEFFKGTRRKVGCVALLTSLGLMGFWIRGHYFQDCFEFCPNQSIYGATSGYGYFALMECRFPARVDAIAASSVQVSPLKSLAIGWNSTAITEPLGNSGPWSNANAESRWECGGAVCGYACFGPRFPFDKKYLLVPCSMVVVPLTLLSAYLLIWPSRHVKRAIPIASSHPISN